MFTFRNWRTWWRGEDGVSTVLIALLTLPLVGVIGLSVDAANLYMVHSRLSYAADAAALAGGRAYFNSTRDADVQAYLSANFPPGYYGATVATPTITENAKRTDLTVDVTATVPTLFMKIFGVNTVAMSASSTVERQGGLEVALVLDVTGSMSMPSSKLTSMQAGAKVLLDTIYDSTMPADSVYAAIVPFRTAVNIGKTHTSWIKTTVKLDSTGPFKSEGWRGCVEQRDTATNGSDGLPLDISIDVPSGGTKLFDPYIYEDTSKMGPSGNGKIVSTYTKTTYDRRGRPTTTTITDNYFFDNNWPSNLNGNTYGSKVDAVGPNLNCPESPVVPLSSLSTDKTKLKNAISGFTTVVRGGTQIVLGLTWGWRVLAKDWQPYWGSTIDTTKPRAKVLVLLTDGDNQVVDWGAYEENSTNGYNYYGLPGSPASIATTSAPHSTANPNYGGTSDYTAYGRLRPTYKGTTANTVKGTIDASKAGILGATSIDDLRDKLTERQLKACDEIKKQGITIVTIGYEVPSSAVDGLKKCASQTNLYLSANESTIQQTFKDLGKTLTQLRIIK